MTYALTQHAAVRTQQRGMPHHLIDALISYAVCEAPVGGACTVLRMTRDRLEDPDLADRLGAERERPRGLSIVWSERTGQICHRSKDAKGLCGPTLPSREQLSILAGGIETLCSPRASGIKKMLNEGGRHIVIRRQGD